ncbi:hypothetical protein DFP72DRAFT_1043182 [Ephemerocybe angulata]|uniref:Uncharacterized protein n=1 Tax=Ephemerocybe angulata TaxID=980116 RepID=A0A8H6I830_9AGAR|nr:hypothetical protein DFP72DRAFT_1043182 [Tulosesus angulatus]
MIIQLSPKPKAKRRSKELQNAIKELPSLSSQSFVTTLGASENPTNVSKGLGKLPPELVSEVLSCWKPIKNETMLVVGQDAEYIRGPTLDKSYLARTDALRALSQTCVAYRRAYLPILWRELDACVSTREGVDDMGTYQWFKHLGMALFRKSSLLSHNAGLANLVREMHVTITRFQADVVLPAFIECLESLPNLHTIHLLHVHTALGPALRKATDGLCLPGVRTFIGPNYSHDILKSCPNVQSVECNREDGAKLIRAMAGNCKDVKVVRGINMDGDAKLMKQLVKAAPKLHTLEVGEKITDEAITELKLLQALSAIDFFAREKVRDRDAAARMEEKKTVLKLQALLRASPSSEIKRLRTCSRKEYYPVSGEKGQHWGWHRELVTKYVEIEV